MKTIIKLILIAVVLGIVVVQIIGVVTHQPCPSAPAACSAPPSSYHDDPPYEPHYGGW